MKNVTGKLKWTAKFKRLIFHLKRRVKRKVIFDGPTSPREWETQLLNKLKLYRNYIVKKAEISPIR